MCVHLTYLGETKNEILSVVLEHQTKKWDNSGVAEHTLSCHGQFNWIHPKTIAKESD